MGATHKPALVAIGCSWGGLDAVSALLDALPDDFALPIALVQHRAAGSSDLTLMALLARHTPMAVKGIEDKAPIEPGTVHLAPPDYHLLVEPGRFALSTEARVRSARPSADVLFETVADAYGTGAVGVVLTGAGSDGARGLARIEQRGGRTLVQDPSSATRPEMPRAALATCKPDVAGAPGDLAAALGRLGSGGSLTTVARGRGGAR
jgi:two-component system chemotaxis response regulator CheB